MNTWIALPLVDTAAAASASVGGGIFCLWAVLCSKFRTFDYFFLLRLNLLANREPIDTYIQCDVFRFYFFFFSLLHCLVFVVYQIPNRKVSISLERCCSCSFFWLLSQMAFHINEIRLAKKCHKKKQIANDSVSTISKY